MIGVEVTTFAKVMEAGVPTAVATRPAAAADTAITVAAAVDLDVLITLVDPVVQDLPRQWAGPPSRLLESL